MIYRASLKLKARPPFDFHKCIAIFGKGDDQIRAGRDGKYWQVIRINRNLVLATIASTGTVNAPALAVELESNQKLTKVEILQAKATITRLFNLELDLRPFYRHTAKDKIMTRLVQKLFGLKPPRTETVFEALIDSIIEQQISLRAAQSMEVKLVKAFGAKLELDHRIYYIYPTPQALASAAVSALQKCGLSGRKIEYIKDISAMVASRELDLDKFEHYKDPEKIVSELDEVRGIGVWTAELTALRGLGRLEVIPADDLGVRRCISDYYRHGRKVSASAARKLATQWGYFKGMATFYLIMAEHMGITPDY
jgi:DNA-3-methyladenine glycosylase II